MTKSKKFEVEVFKQALARYEVQYTEVLQVWRNFEAKAQSTLTISGVLISVSGLLIKQSREIIPTQMHLIFAVAIILLVISVASSIQVLQVRQTTTSPSGEVYKQLSIDLVEAIDSEAEISHEYQINLIHDKMRIWDAATKERQEGCQDKANFLKFANYSLLLSLALIALVIIMAIQ